MRYTLLAAALGAGLWLASFAWFSVVALSLDNVEPLAAGCVSIFSGRHDRVLAGIDRFANTNVPHMLITGATEGTNHLERAEMVARAPGYFDCCAEFEWEARNTRENAAVTVAWARRVGCSRLTVVTDDFHLPRALALTRKADPEMNVRGQAIRYVRNGQLSRRARVNLLVREFHGYIAVWFIPRAQ